MPNIKFENLNHWLVVRFNTPRLTDPLTVSEVEELLTRQVDALPTRCQVAVSFSGVEFVSSQVIGLLLGLRDQIKRKHGTLVLCKLNKHVLDIMRVTRLDRQFTLSESLRAVVGQRKMAVSGSDDVEWMD
jgi:anti-anti-sigma factor